MEEFLINYYWLIIGLALFSCIALVGYLYEEKKKKDAALAYEKKMIERNNTEVETI